MLPNNMRKITWNSHGLDKELYECTKLYCVNLYFYIYYVLNIVYYMWATVALVAVFYTAKEYVDERFP